MKRMTQQVCSLVCFLFIVHANGQNFNQVQFLNDKEEIKGTHVFQLKENSNLPSLLNSSFLENQNTSSTLFYNSPNNYIKVGLSPITPVIEYQHCTSFQRSSRGTFQNIGKYWVGQLGWNPIWPYHVTLGVKRSYTFDHLETGVGFLITSVGIIAGSTPVLPAVNVGFTTLGTKQNFRFSCGLGIPELVYLGFNFPL
jgi:hypothetical protein